MHLLYFTKDPLFQTKNFKNSSFFHGFDIMLQILRVLVGAMIFYSKEPNIGSDKKFDVG